MGEKDTAETSKLAIVWTSADREVAFKMAFMYAYNAKKNGWWDEVKLVVWGPSAKLLAGDEDLQTEIFEMKTIGVEMVACEACADQ